ncbi:hypothetical protein AB0945_17850 [Streptomyces sp. NPDC005474]|uniref:hypothetical protein n=1 Tax=Streptomyces sp. NPDC005474 TaxID=3154878 RepID=UPI003456B078
MMLQTDPPSTLSPVPRFDGLREQAHAQQVVDDSAAPDGHGFSNLLGTATTQGSAPPPSFPLISEAIRRAAPVQNQARANLDAPDHTRRRPLVVETFSAKPVKEPRPAVQALAGQLPARVPGAPQSDLPKTLAQPVSVQNRVAAGGSNG